MSRPDSEHEYPPNAGWWETSLPEMLLAQQEQVFEAERRMHEAEARYERLDEALALLEYALAGGSRALNRDAVLILLGEVGRRGATGLSAEWMGRVREMMRGPR